MNFYLTTLDYLILIVAKSGLFLFLVALALGLLYCAVNYTFKLWLARLSRQLHRDMIRSYRETNPEAFTEYDRLQKWHDKFTFGD